MSNLLMAILRIATFVRIESTFWGDICKVIDPYLLGRNDVPLSLLLREGSFALLILLRIRNCFPYRLIFLYDVILRFSLFPQMSLFFGIFLCDNDM